MEQVTQLAGLELGYPVAFDLDFSALMPFLAISLNNAGDPFVPMTYQLNSHEFEREVVSFFADLTRAPADQWWGYVTNGSTEGNLYGLYLARELFPDGMVYFSQDCHYSVSKNLHFLNMRHIMIRSQENGEIDYDDLAANPADSAGCAADHFCQCGHDHERSPRRCGQDLFHPG